LRPRHHCHRRDQAHQCHNFRHVHHPRNCVAPKRPS
jgi:hypothetical protein